MSAYSPTLPRTADLRGLDRLLVRVGSHLTSLGRRRAAARARALAARTAQAGVRELDELARGHLERLDDNAAQTHPLLLR
ncbi:hypothetical protein V5D56_18890 [Cellulosimicrobium sp. PMB13]|uniref:hypothetical protein n=1 Tax=Cellulosimicrobium sp. PMB13 TaxID=3120158 RepID=UPI003F4CAAA7